MRRQVLTTAVFCLLSGSPRQCLPEQTNRFVDVTSPSFQYLGAWQTTSAGRYTVYAGSQVRFCLKGKARIAVRSGLPGTIRAMVRRGESVAWDGILGESDIEIDAGTAAAPFSIVYLTSNKKGFDPSIPDAKGAEFLFQGLTLDQDAALLDPPRIRSEILLDFVGDSITAGVDGFGRSGTWDKTSDVRVSYAFRLAEELGVRYRIRAFPGAGCGDMPGRFAFFRKGAPLATNERPDIVFVNIGANNREGGTSFYQARMSNLLDVVFETYPQTQVVLLNFFRMTPNRLPVLRELARSHPNGKVICFDARRYLVGYSDGGVHPDVESHRKLAEALAAYLTQGPLREQRGAHE